MSNTRPEPCTKVRGVGQALYRPPLRHLSYALAGTKQMIGRVGPTICGLRGAVDQERAAYLISRAYPYLNFKIHELKPCQPCHRFLRR